jgi:hypothetical protein
MSRFLFSALSLCSIAAQVVALELAVTLRPEHAALPVPVEVDVTQPLAGAGGAGGWQLEPLTPAGAKPLAAQIVKSDGRVLLCFIVPPAAGKQAVPLRFTLARTKRGEPAAFTIEDAGGGPLRIAENGRPVLVYNRAMMLKEGVAEKYRRACYVHPLHDLDGVVLTDDFPKDHFHHRGLFWAWPRVKPAGESKDCDIWACAGGGQRFQSVLGKETGPVCARLGLSSAWFVGGRKVVDEAVWLTVFRAGDTGRAMDVDLRLKAVDQPVVIGGREKKGYGGFTLRFAPRQEQVLWTKDGKLPKDADHDRYPWADYSAKFGGTDRVSGAAIFDHAQNAGFPNTWCLRNYGILSPTYPGEGTHELTPGQALRLRYRVWIHRGDAQAGKAAGAYAAFAQPPRVEVASKP